ncbi:MAG: protein kinase [Sandaracinus sp.]|nr:protein kinase [Sandaracinus sp.]
MTAATLAELETRLGAQGEDSRSLAFGATIRPTMPGYGVDLRARPSVAVEATPDELDSMAGPLPEITLDLREGAARARGPSGADLEVRGTLGQGGMGRVLLARQRSLAREVAVKTTHPNASPAIRDALIFEGVVTGRLEHPAIVPVHALGVDAEGRPAIVMKRIEGVAWSALVADPAHPAWEDWSDDPDDRLPGHLQILLVVCNALHFAHSRGFVHRDLKPENVLIGRYGDVYVADWGIAAKVGEKSGDQICGTPGYLAPEMVTQGVVDARTDVYLLGAVLHEVLTGKRRHGGSSIVQALLSASLSDPHDYGDEVPTELASLANGACARDPKTRPATARAFRDLLASYLRHRESVAIGREALERLERLEAVLGEEAAPERERTIDRLAAEARFGLERALEGFEEFEDARRGLARLEGILEARHRRTAELERLAHAMDPRVGERWRAYGLSLLALVGVGLVVLSYAVHRQPSPEVIFAYAATIFAIVVVVGFVARRHLLGNELGRRALVVMLLATGFLFFNRGLNVLHPSPIAEVLARDAFSVAGVTSVAAVTLFRFAGAAAVAFLATGVAVLIWPEHALDVFACGAASATVVSALLAWRMKPDAPVSRDGA